MVDIRTNAANVMASILPDLPIKSSLAEEKDNPKFTKYTMVHTHAELMQYWSDHRPPDRHVLTTCNEFVNYYCDRIGFRAKLGGFDIPDVMRKANLTLGYVTSEFGKYPKPGDIIRWKSTHMDVCYECDGTSLTRLASGQHGPDRDGAGAPKPGTSYDLIAKVTKPYSWAEIDGWFDLDLIWPQEMPVPQWLHGWWKHVFDDSGDTYYYHFAMNRVVKWTQVAPIAQWSPVVAKDGGPGMFTNDTDSQVTINWASGSTEVYTWTDTDTMTGKYKYDTLTATKVSR